MATNLERYGVFALIFVVLLIVSISIWGPDDSSVPPSTASVSAADELLGGTSDLERAWANSDFATQFIQEGLSESQTPIAGNESPVMTTGLREYKVRKGDNPSKIAKRFYGKETLFTRILEANPGLQPRNLQLGQVILIPDPPVEQDPLAGAILDPQANAMSVVPERSDARTHTVRKGERLSEIAKRYYGNSALVQPIVDANQRITDPDRIGEGWVLVIPDRR